MITPSHPNTGALSLQVAFMGNNLNDLEGLGWVRKPFVLADPVPAVRRVARFVTTREGAMGPCANGVI